MQHPYSVYSKISEENNLQSLRKDIMQILKDLCKWKGIEIIEGNMMPDHVHMLGSDSTQI